MYKRWNRSNSSGLITLGAAFCFVQVLYRLGELPIDRPMILSAVFEFSSYSSIKGVLRLTDFRYECYFGLDGTYSAMLELCAPASPIFCMCLFF